MGNRVPYTPVKFQSITHRIGRGQALFVWQGCARLCVVTTSNLPRVYETIRPRHAITRRFWGTTVVQYNSDTIVTSAPIEQRRQRMSPGWFCSSRRFAQLELIRWTWEVVVFSEIFSLQLAQLVVRHIIMFEKVEVWCYFVIKWVRYQMAGDINNMAQISRRI